MKSTIKVILLLAMIPLWYSCGGNKKAKESKPAAAEEKQALEVKLSPEQVSAIGLELGSPAERNLKTSLKVNGKLMLPPQNKAEVSLLTGGRIKEILVKEGAEVKKGQRLATIENTDFLQLQQDYLENKAHLKFLTSEYERQKELQKDNINSGKVVQQSEADYLTAQAKDKTLTERLGLFGVNPSTLTAAGVTSTFSVTAPIDGHVRIRDINIGTYAEPNKQLFDIIDNRFLHLDLTVFEQDIHKLKEGQHLTFSDANDASHIHNATIFSINKSFEDNQQAVIVHAKIEDVTEALMPGMFIEARVQIDNYKALSLPSDAVVNSGNEHYIYVQQQPNVFKQVQVRVGTTDMGFTEIIPLEAIDKDAKVVVKGAYYLLSELTKGKGEGD